MLSASTQVLRLLERQRPQQNGIPRPLMAVGSAFRQIRYIFGHNGCFDTDSCCRMKMEGSCFLAGSTSGGRLVATARLVLKSAKQIKADNAIESHQIVSS